MEAEGKVIKQVGGGRGFYALVKLRCADIGCNPTVVTLEPSAVSEWYHREEFVVAAIRGVQFALALAGTSAQCTITRIHGMPVDTSQCTVTIAAIRATWLAVGFEPCKELTELLESILLKLPPLSLTEIERLLLESI